MRLGNYNGGSQKYNIGPIVIKNVCGATVKIGDLILPPMGVKRIGYHNLLPGNPVQTMWHKGILDIIKWPDDIDHESFQPVSQPQGATLYRLPLGYTRRGLGNIA